MADTKQTNRAVAASFSTTAFDRPLIDIDGKMYEMLHPDELSVPLVHQTMEAEALMASVESDTAGERFDKMVDAINRLLGVVMVDLPNDVRERLTPRQRMRIVSTFNRLAGDDKAASPAG